MTPQILENLLLDDALGATTPEVHTLLQAYLENNPAARAQMDQWKNLAALTRAAMEPATKKAPPPFPRERLRAAQRTSIIGRILLTSGLAAACLLLGFTFGTRRQSVAPATPPLAQSSSPVRAAASLSAVASVAQVQSIWSMDRLRAAALRNEAQNAAAARHTSLWQQLQLGGHL